MINTLALCSWSLKPSSIQDLCAKMKICGVSSAQLALGPIARGEWDIDDTRDSLSQAQISVCSGMMTTLGEDYTTLETIKRTGGLRPDEHWDHNLAHARDCAQIAQTLGLNLITLHAGFVPQDDPALHKVMAQRITQVAQVFSEHGVKLGLETGQEGASTLLELLSTISESGQRVGVNFDPANMVLYAMGDPIAAMSELSEHIVQVHMKDATATATPGTWGAEVPAGDGQVDWEAFFRIVESLPRPIDVVIEREAGDDRVGDIIRARELARTFTRSAHA